MTRPVILSLGSINADFQMRVPAEIGDIETQLAHDFVRLSGGKAANRAYLARRFGHPVSFSAASATTSWRGRRWSRWRRTVSTSPA